MNIDPVIEVKNVWKSFKTVQAVKGIDLKIPKGQFVALLGPNGAGKTTLVEMIEGIQKPDKGEITIMGKKWKGNEDELHNIIGLSLQETRFIDKLRVSETLLLFAGFFNLGKERVNEIINIVGLEDKRKSLVDMVWDKISILPFNSLQISNLSPAIIKPSIPANSSPLAYRKEINRSNPSEI